MSLPDSPPRLIQMFQDGGPIGALLQATDWSASALGHPDHWAPELRNCVSLMLRARQPMHLCWGPDLLTIYNAAYAEMYGSRHPHNFGKPMREVWPELWSEIEPLVQDTLSGESQNFQDLKLHPQGTINSERWFSFSWTPLRDEKFKVQGFFCVATETTSKMLALRAAKHERDRFGELFEQVPTFVAVLRGKSHVIEFANPGYFRLIGHRDVIGQPVAQALPEAVEQGFVALLDSVAASGKAYAAKGGKYNAQAFPGGPLQERFVDFVYQPIRDNKGDINGIFVEGVDVTERTLAESALRAMSLDVEREVVERTHARGRTWQMSPYLLSVMNVAGYFEDINPAWTATLGWPEEILRRERFLAFVHPDDVHASLDAYELVKSGEAVLQFENRYRCADGSYRWLSWVAVPEGGKFYCTARDITPEKAAEAERAELWALSEDMLARADYAGNMRAANPAWTKILGYSVHEVLTRPYANIIHPDSIGPTVAALEQMRQTGEPARFENLILTASGHWKPIGWTVSPEPDDHHFIAVGRDLSEDKARQHELLLAQEALRQSQKMEAVGQLTGGIAHDFNNLLAGISGSLEQLSKRVDQGRFDSVEKYIAMAQGSARRAATLTQRLLAFSRRQTLDPRPLDANRLVFGLEDLIRRTVGPSVQVEVVGADALWSINADVSQLENALLNLCINASDAMLPDGGRLTIETGNQWLDERAARELDLLPGQYVSLCVTDTGSGMTPEVTARAFDPFFTTKPMGQGTGLGLSMIYGFVRQSGGQVRIDSDLGKGTAMCIYLPRHTGEVPAQELDTAGNLIAPGDGEVVLVIDDEATIRMIIAEVLEDLGYRVIEAEDGPSGLKILQSGGRIDLLVTDVGLPGGMNGRQVADAARVARPALKILFITGYAENAAVGNGYLEAGMQVLTKPFEMTALANKVSDILES